MKLKLISDCNYNINFKVSCLSNKKICLLSGKTLLLEIPPCEKFSITPLSVKYNLSFLQKAVKIVFVVLFFLVYCILIPFMNRNSINKTSEFIFIDKLEISSPALEKELIEITYSCKEDSLFEEKRIKSTIQGTTQGTVLCVDKLKRQVGLYVK